MTKVLLNRATFTQINSAAQRIQVFGGRIQVADSASPTEEDWHTWPENAVVDVVAVKYARAFDTKPTYVVALAV